MKFHLHADPLIVLSAKHIHIDTSAIAETINVALCTQTLCALAFHTEFPNKMMSVNAKCLNVVVRPSLGKNEVRNETITCFNRRYKSDDNCRNLCCREMSHHLNGL